MTLPALEELQRIAQWVCWRWEIRPGKTKPTKPPYRPDGRNADVTDSSTWSTYAATVGRGDGNGFVVRAGGGLVGIDIDHCRNPQTGVIADWALALVGRVGSYTEVTPSGTGLRIWVRGRWPSARHKHVIDEHSHVEIYDSERFFCVTGEHLPGTPDRICDRQRILDELAAEWSPPTRDPVDTDPPNGAAPLLRDDQVLTLAVSAGNGPKVQALLRGEGDGHPSLSEADMALLCHLVFYTRDPVQLERLWLGSGLRRAHVERVSYRALTISKALALVDKRYHEGQPAPGEPPAAMTPHIYRADQVREVVRDPLDFLPVLGHDGYVVSGWTHLLAGWWRDGKTVLLFAVVIGWLLGQRRVVWVTEEPASLWWSRIDQADEDTPPHAPIPWDHLTFVEASSAEPAQLLSATAALPADVVIVDTIQECCGIAAMNDDEAVTRAVRPWLRTLRDHVRTLLFVAQYRKSAGERGARVLGSVRLPSMMDVVLEYEHLEGAGNDRRRRLSVRRRGEPTPPLVVELDTDERIVVVPDARSRTRRDTEVAVSAVLAATGDWLTTTEVRRRLLAPPPSRDTVQRALTMLVQAGEAFRDPAPGDARPGMTLRWRGVTAGPSPPSPTSATSQPPQQIQPLASQIASGGSAEVLGAPNASGTPRSGASHTRLWRRDNKDPSAVNGIPGMRLTFGYDDCGIPHGVAINHTPQASAGGDQEQEETAVPIDYDHAMQDVPRGSGSYLSALDKEAFEAARTPFFVTAIERENEGKYGANWVFTLALEGETRRLSLAATESRDILAGRWIELLKEDSIGPLRLQRVSTKGGSLAWTFQPVDDRTVDEQPVAEKPADDGWIWAPEAPPSTAGVSGEIDPDDIPF